jgi:hypothetical protein
MKQRWRRQGGDGAENKAEAAARSTCALGASTAGARTNAVGCFGVS